MFKRKVSAFREDQKNKNILVRFAFHKSIILEDLSLLNKYWWKHTAHSTSLKVEAKETSNPNGVIIWRGGNSTQQKQRHWHTKLQIWNPPLTPLTLRRLIPNFPPKHPFIFFCEWFQSKQIKNHLTLSLIIPISKSQNKNSLSLSLSLSLWIYTPISISIDRKKEHSWLNSESESYSPCLCYSHSSHFESVAGSCRSNLVSPECSFWTRFRFVFASSNPNSTLYVLSCCVGEALISYLGFLLC